MKNYKEIELLDMKKIIGGGKYDKQGYNLGNAVGNVIRGAGTLWGIFK